MGFDFKSWLLRIAVSHPHLSQAENYARQSLFAETTVAIREVLLQAILIVEERGDARGFTPLHLWSRVPLSQ